MAVPSASPCPAQAGGDGKLLWEGALAVSVPFGRSSWRGLLGTCGWPELQLLPAVGVSLSVPAV